MNKKMPHAIVAKNLRAVGVGGTVGAAAGLALYFTMPALHQAGLSVDALTALGAAVGTALHHSVVPVLVVLAHYRRMLEIELARRVGWMTDESAARIMQAIQARYFLGTEKGFRKGSEEVPKGSEKVLGSETVQKSSASVQGSQKADKRSVRNQRRSTMARKNSPEVPTVQGFKHKVRAA